MQLLLNLASGALPWAYLTEISGFYLLLGKVNVKSALEAWLLLEDISLRWGGGWTEPPAV